VSQCAGMQGHVWATKVLGLKFPREHDRLGAAVARRGQQLERAAAVGPGAVAQMAKRGERGIGEREHARVYPNARSDAAAASKTNARVGLQWCHSLGKSVCFSMCAGSAYWCHLSAKSFAISTNGTIRSESADHACGAVRNEDRRRPAAR